MIDESMDTDQMKQPMQPWEFRAKPAWQRLLIMVGGVVFNFLLALFIYSMILFTWGDSYVPVQKAPLGMDFNETAKAVGFRDGDILLSADGVPFERMGGDLLTAVVDARQVSVLRNGQETSIYIPENMMDRLLADSARFADFRFPFVIDSIMPDKPAALAGLQVGDSITQLNGQNIAYLDFKEEMLNRAKADTASHDITLTYVRQGVSHEISLTTDSAFNIGVAPVLRTDKLMPVIKKNYTLISAIPAGITLGVNTLKGYVGQMKYLFSKEGAKQLGGFGAIGSIFPASWDWHQFWYMTAFLSIILAFMNILPIPALDGGHVLFLLYEIIARRKPSDAFMERAQMVGMFLLLALMIWANFNDILRYLF